jgi:hypothetical protein
MLWQAFGDTTLSAGGSTAAKEGINMGDKSPKSVQKQAAQKKSKANDLQKAKQRALAEKQAGSLKKR